MNTADSIVAITKAIEALRNAEVGLSYVSVYMTENQSDFTIDKVKKARSSILELHAIACNELQKIKNNTCNSNCGGV